MRTSKITIVGDIMCEPLLIRAAKNQNGYDFSETFSSGIKQLFSSSDVVIGNLETPLAGQEVKYCEELYSFNAPDEFADAIVTAGISFVTTANNHCLDRGIQGLERTVRVLNAKRLKHTGTFIQENDGIDYLYANGLKIAVLSCTYGTNLSSNHQRLQPEQSFCVNMIRPQDSVLNTKHKEKKHRCLHFFKRAFFKCLRMARIKEWKIQQLNKLCKTDVTIPYADDNVDIDNTKEYVDGIIDKLKIAKGNSDFVLFFPHMGGQFNEHPGLFSEYVMDTAVKSGFCDAIVASHPHVVQKAEFRNNIPCFYSLGNFSMSPNSYYIPKDADTDIGIAVHLYLDGSNISDVTFSFILMIEKGKKMMKVEHVCEEKMCITDALREKIQKAYSTITGGKLDDNEPIFTEYKLRRQ